MEPWEFEEGILGTTIERKPVLTALSEAPHHRKELQEKLDISKTTCHRIVRTFDEMGLLDRTDRGYELSPKGQLVEQQVDAYYERMAAACHLAPIAEAFEETPVTFDLDLFADATITRPDENDPNRPINREFDLFKQAQTFRTVDGNQWVPSMYLEQLFEIGIEKGMRGEHITTWEIIERRVTNHAEIHKQHDDVQAQLRYRIHDEIPFGLVLYDDSHVVVRAYDDETGAAIVMADTDNPDAVEWAEAVVERYRESAEPPSAFEELPDWTPDADLEL